MRTSWIVLMLILALAVGCARTSITSQRDSGIEDYKYSTIMVESTFKDLGLRRGMRDDSRQHTASPRLLGLSRPWMQSFTGREQNAESLQHVIDKYAIDAWLMIGCGWLRNNKDLHSQDDAHQSQGHDLWQHNHWICHDTRIRRVQHF